MRSAGYCDVCQQNVYLDGWACNAGHDHTHVSAWYNGETGQPLTPPWLEQPPPPPVPPTPIPEPIDPAGAMLELLTRQAAAAGLTVVAENSTLSITRGDDYEAVVAADGATAQVILWEHLFAGADPGLRDVVRGTAKDAGWSVRVALRRPVSSG